MSSVARLARGRAHQVALVDEADAHRVDERVAGVGRGEADFSAHVGDADAVAVARYAGDDPGEQVAVAGAGQRPEPQRVEQRDRTGAHRQDVADDAAHPGRRALVGLDGGGVVVRLDLHDDGLAVADAHDAGVLGALAHEQAGAVAGELPQQRPGVLVAAVLAPERAEQPQLQRVGLPAQPLDDRLVLALRQGEVLELFTRRGHRFRRGGPAGVGERQASGRFFR